MVTLVSFLVVVVVEVNRIGIVCSCNSGNVCSGDNDNNSRDGSDVSGPNDECCSSISSYSDKCTSSGSRVIVDRSRLYCLSTFIGCRKNKEKVCVCKCLLLEKCLVIFYIYDIY